MMLPAPCSDSPTPPRIDSLAHVVTPSLAVLPGIECSISLLVHLLNLFVLDSFAPVRSEVNPFVTTPVPGGVTAQISCLAKEINSFVKDGHFKTPLTRAHPAADH